MGQIELYLAGETVLAVADRVLVWPAERTVFLADLHLGKDAAFRSAGGWVPPGTTGSDLRRLTTVLGNAGAQRLVVLGDIFHSEHAQEPATMDVVNDWRSNHPHLEIILIAGNHDRRALRLAQDHGFRLEAEGRRLGPWVLCHHPVESKSGYVLCGHVHPRIRLFSSARESLRLPCFLAGPRRCLLPAFSEFTGGAFVTAARDEQVIAIADREVIDVTARTRGG